MSDFEFKDEEPKKAKKADALVLVFGKERLKLPPPPNAGEVNVGADSKK